ncbi:MAG: DUF721 domain-containing protein [Acidimicrobiia bacterium]
MRGEDFDDLGSALDQVFARLGVESPALMAKVMESWEEVAGSPWTERSRPIFIRGKTLVVEAFSPSAVALLKYQAGQLAEALRRALGEGTIEAIEVVPPERR